jgi:hypothetical protein
VCEVYTDNDAVIDFEMPFHWKMSVCLLTDLRCKICLSIHQLSLLIPFARIRTVTTC